MKGSILFNKDINIEVDVDPSAEEGARLISAKNLVDGQEAGGGGESGLFEIEYDGVDTYTFKITPNQVADLLDAGVMPWCNNIPAELAVLWELPDGSIIVIPNVDLEEHDCFYITVIPYDGVLTGTSTVSDNDTYFNFVDE